MLSYSITQVAKILSLHKNTVRKMIKEHKILSLQTSSGAYEVAHKDLYRYIVYTNYEKAISMIPEEKDLFTNMNLFLERLPQCLEILDTNLDFHGTGKKYNHAVGLGEHLIGSSRHAVSNTHILSGEEKIKQKEIPIFGRDMNTQEFEDFTREDSYIIHECSKLSDLVRLYYRSCGTGPGSLYYFVIFPKIEYACTYLKSPEEYIASLFTFRYYIDLFTNGGYYDGKLFMRTLYIIIAMIKKFHFRKMEIPQELKPIIDSKFNCLSEEDFITYVKEHIFNAFEDVEFEPFENVAEFPSQRNKKENLESFIDALIGKAYPNNFQEYKEKYLQYKHDDYVQKLSELIQNTIHTEQKKFLKE